MDVPGSDLLSLAFDIITSQTVGYYNYLSRVANDAGQLVSTFDDPIDIDGSFQAVPRKLYEVYGLDFSKNYSTFYASENVLDVTRDVTGDQIVYRGARFQVLSANDWFKQDGWVGVLCVFLYYELDSEKKKRAN